MHDSKFRLEILEMLSESGASAARRLDRVDRGRSADFLEPISRSLRASKRLARQAAVAMRRHSRRALLHTCQTIFFVTVTVVSAIALVNGIIGGLTRLFGGVPWVGELVGASLLLGATVVVVIASTARDDRRPTIEPQVPSSEPVALEHEAL